MIWLIDCSLKTNSIPIMHNMLKEYIKEEMRKGTYKEIQFKPLSFIPYDNINLDDLEDMTMDEED